MSYWSDVAITCYKSDFKEYISQHPDTDMLRGLSIHKYSDAVIVLYWESIKWDNCYPEVKEFADWLKGIAHRFIRVGETAGDVEDYYCNDDDDSGLEGAAEPVTSITINSDTILSVNELLSLDNSVPSSST